MRDRTLILNDLVKLQGNSIKLKQELDQYSFDFNEPLIILTKIDFYNLLSKSIAGEITFEELEDWANVIECRDDIGFENDEIQEIIFELANPEINGPITNDRLKEIVTKL